MKKVLLTSLFRFLVVFLFWAYVKLLDHDLGSNVANIFYKAKGGEVIVNNAGINSGSLQELKEQLSKIEEQINNLNLNMQSNGDNVGKNDQSLEKKGNTEVSLYYFNNKEDIKLPVSQQINVNSILPVKRMITDSKNIIWDTINLLLDGNLSQVEKDNGFVTEFPNTSFKLVNMDLSPEGILTLTFTEVPGFTSGGSARMAIMANSISKTVKQFSQVKEVKFMPEELFQP